MKAATMLVVLCGMLAMACGGGADPDAPQTASANEIPGTSDPDDVDPLTAQRWVDNVHLGTALDRNGKVPSENRASEFDTEQTIYLSLEITDAPAGSVVRVALIDEDGDEEVWADERSVPAGQSHIHFAVDGDEFEPGDYRAEVIIGDERVAVRRLALQEPAA